MIIGLYLALLGAQAVDTYGKTEAEILKMGQDAWYKFYTANAGDSTAAMTNAYGVYADIASARNDRLLADPKLPRRAKIAVLRKMLQEFSGDMDSLGSEITGGGTMWNTITAQGYADAQDTVYAVIHPEGLPKPARLVVSDILKLIDKLPAKIQEEVGDGVITKDQFKTAPKDIRDARSLFLKIAKSAAGFDRSTSDRILGFCKDQATLPISN